MTGPGRTPSRIATWRRAAALLAIAALAAGSAACSSADRPSASPTAGSGAAPADHDMSAMDHDMSAMEHEDPAPAPAAPAPTARSGSPLSTAEVEALFPPAPSPEAARTACTSAHADMDMDPGMGSGAEPQAASSAQLRRASDGTYERVFDRSPGARVEVLAVPFDSKPTDEQVRAAAAFVEEVRRSITEHGWTDPAQIVRDGYRPMTPCDPHFVNIEAARDGVVLDPDHPEYLLLDQREDGTTVVRGMMFMADRFDHGPDRFGPLAPWHYHVQESCTVDNLIVPASGRGCPEGSELSHRSAEMVHVDVEGEPFPGTM